MNKPRLNTGIVGFGLSGKVFHAPFLDALEGFNLASVVERHSKHSREQYPAVKVVGDYEEMLADNSLDLVVICTPNTLHFSMVKAGLEAGKHVVIEKPFVPTYREAEELIRIAEKNERKLFVYHNRRWDGDFLTIQKLVKQDILGEVVEYITHFDRYRPEMPGNAWRDQDKPGGGIVYDLGSHLIDQALVLFGMPRAVFADIKAQRPGSEVDDYFHIHLYYPGKTAILKAGMIVKEQGPRFILHGRKGSYIKFGLDPQEEALKQGASPMIEGWGAENRDSWGILNIFKDGKTIVDKTETLHGAYQDFYKNVYDVIVNGKEMAIQPQQAADVINILELAFESSAAGEIRRIE